MSGSACCFSAMALTRQNTALPPSVRPSGQDGADGNTDQNTITTTRPDYRIRHSVSIIFKFLPHLTTRIKKIGKDIILKPQSLLPIQIKNNWEDSTTRPARLSYSPHCVYHFKVPTSLVYTNKEHRGEYYLKASNSLTHINREHWREFDHHPCQIVVFPTLYLSL